MSAEVRSMFASIAPRYDAVNEVLSLGIHKGWRRKAVQLSGAAKGQRVGVSVEIDVDVAQIFTRESRENRPFGEQITVGHVRAVEAIDERRVPAGARLDQGHLEVAEALQQRVLPRC